MTMWPVSRPWVAWVYPTTSAVWLLFFVLMKPGGSMASALKSQGDRHYNLLEFCSMANQKPLRLNTISEFHQLNGLPKPEHPLISIVDYAKLNRSNAENPGALIFGYYTI